MLNSTFRAAILAAVLAGCTPVLSEAPVGSSAAAIGADQVEGVWVSSSEPGEMYCCTFLQLVEPDDPDTDDRGKDMSTAGAFQMINISNDRGQLFALHWDGRFMTHKDVLFANVSLSRTANVEEYVQAWDTGAYLFGLMKIESLDKIRIFFPDSSAFSRSIEEGHLPAGQGCRDDSVCLGPLSAAHLDFLTTPECLKTHFKDEIVFRRFPFSPS
jgi:hypothetical protein